MQPLKFGNSKVILSLFQYGCHYLFMLVIKIISSPPSAAFVRQWIGSALVKVMACRQAITWTNVSLLLIGPLVTNFTEIRNEIQNDSLMKMHLKMLSVKLAAIFPRGGGGMMLVNGSPGIPLFRSCTSLPPSPTSSSSSSASGTPSSLAR